MFSYLYSTIVYGPLYNGLVFLLSLLSEPANAGIAIILFTIVVKILLFPLSRVAIKTQMRMKEIEPELNDIKEKHKKDRQTQSLKMMALYKEKGINPFSGFFLILIQIPIIFALYRIFLFGGLPIINTEILYSWVSAPLLVNMTFLTVNLAEKSYILAVIAAVSQYFQARYAMPKMAPAEKGKTGFQHDFQKTMHFQMKYFLPIMVFFISYHIASAAALYWATSNIFAIIQEVMVRRKYKTIIVPKSITR